MADFAQVVFVYGWERTAEAAHGRYKINKLALGVTGGRDHPACDDRTLHETWTRRSVSPNQPEERLKRECQNHLPGTRPCQREGRRGGAMKSPRRSAFCPDPQPAPRYLRHPRGRRFPQPSVAGKNPFGRSVRHRVSA